MGNTQDLRDRSGRLLGRLKEVNGNLELRNRAGKLLGRYNHKTNTTRDRSGKLIGRGNLLASLLE